MGAVGKSYLAREDKGCRSSRRPRSRVVTARAATIAAGFLLVAFACVPALADTEYTRPGAYIGLAGIYAVDASAISAETENSMGLAARLGYRLGPNLAIEGQFEWVDGFDITARAGSRFESWSLTGNLKGLLLTGRIQPFGVLGMGVMRTRFIDAGAGLPPPFDVYSNLTRSGFAMRFGGGVELYVTRNIVVSLDGSYVLPTGSVQDLDYVAFGFSAQWRF